MQERKITVMTRLNNTQIFDALNPDWWVDSQQFLNGALWQTAEIFWQDLIGNYHSFSSIGPCTANSDGSVDATTRTNYIKDVLMAETVRQIANTGCSGGITNVRPKSYQPMPIYST
jgi:hypothetical protein